MDFEFSLTVDDEGKVAYAEVQGVLKILETYVKKLRAERSKRKQGEMRYELALAHLAAQQRMAIDLQAANIELANKAAKERGAVTIDSKGTKNK